VFSPDDEDEETKNFPDIDLSTINKVIVKIELIQFDNIIEPFVLFFKLRRPLIT
jgi:hypothetical protein